jgi:hypothetical protein
MARKEIFVPDLVSSAVSPYVPEKRMEGIT